MIEKFSDVYNRNETNHLLTGDGFNQNFGYNSSLKNILSRVIMRQDFLESTATISLRREESANTETQGKKWEIELATINLREEAPASTSQVQNTPEEHNLIKHSQFHPNEDSKSDFIKTFRLGFIISLMELIEDTSERRERATNFMEKFSNVFTLNHDLFLYRIWLHLSNRTNAGKAKWEMKDGFIKEEDAFLWNEGNEQNLFHLHGALHLSQEEKGGGAVEIRSVLEKDDEEFKRKIFDNFKNGKVWDVILKEEKLQCIEKNIYMKSALHKLSTIEGNLFLYGLSLSKNDDHIWEAIRNNKKINKVFVSVYKDDDEAFRERALAALGDKASDETREEKRVVFFDSASRLSMSRKNR